MPYRLAGFADEISTDIQVQMDHLIENGVMFFFHHPGVVVQTEAHETFERRHAVVLAIVEARVPVAADVVVLLDDGAFADPVADVNADVAGEEIGVRDVGGGVGRGASRKRGEERFVRNVGLHLDVCGAHQLFEF